MRNWAWVIVNSYPKTDYLERTEILIVVKTIKFLSLATGKNHERTYMLLFQLHR